LSNVGNSEIRSLPKLDSEAVVSAPCNCEVNLIKPAIDWSNCWIETVGSDSVEIATSCSNSELSFWLGNVDQVIELVTTLEVEIVWSSDKNHSTELVEDWSHRVQVGAVPRRNLNVVREVVELSGRVHIRSVHKDVIDEELELVPGSFLCDIDNNCVRAVSVVQDARAEVVLGNTRICEGETSRNNTVVVGNDVVELIVELDLEAECVSSFYQDWSFAISRIAIASWDKGCSVLDGDLSSSHDGLSDDDWSPLVNIDLHLVDTGLLEGASWDMNAVVFYARFSSVWIRAKSGARVVSERDNSDISAVVEELSCC